VREEKISDGKLEGKGRERREKKFISLRAETTSNGYFWFAFFCEWSNHESETDSLDQ
jgi:hypothetical protein